MNAGLGLPPFVDLQKGMEEGSGGLSRGNGDPKVRVLSIINSL